MESIPLFVGYTWVLLARSLYHCRRDVETGDVESAFVEGGCLVPRTRSYVHNDALLSWLGGAHDCAYLKVILQLVEDEVIIHTDIEVIIYVWTLLQSELLLRFRCEAFLQSAPVLGKDEP